MMVALQRQFSAGLHHDAFDLITIAAVETLIPPPGSIDASVLEDEIVAVALHVIDQSLDGFSMVLCGDEHSVIHGDDHQVAHPEESDSSSRTEGEAVARSLKNR